MQKISSYLIAGGHSRRMGVDKRTIRIDGETMIERMCRVMERCNGSPPTIVGDNLPEAISGKCRVFSDFQSDVGPLGGLVSALMDSATEWVLAAAVDMPNLTSSDLSLLHDAVEDDCDGYDVITLSSDGKPEPLAGVYRKSTVDFWRRRLDVGELSLRDGIHLLKWRVVRVEADVLRNINRPGDLEEFWTQ